MQNIITATDLGAVKREGESYTLLNRIKINCILQNFLCLFCVCA